MPRGGIKHTEETKRKISEAILKRKKRLGYINSPETRKKLSNINLGKSLSEKTKQKIREALLGRKYSEDFKEKCGKSKLGKNNSMYGRTGSTAPNWKGGITPKHRLIRESLEYRNWREAVFERDRYECQKENCNFCHNNGRVELNAHHIKKFSDFPEERFNLDNGITYCKKYHLKGDIHA